MTTPNLEQIDVIAWALWRERRPYKAFNPAEPNHVEAMTLYRRDAAAVVAAIRDSGLTVIALPEPTGSDDTGRHEWLDGEVCVGVPGNGRVRCYIEDPRMNDDEAAELGAALIAAAQVAESGA
ncbi:hypothetical protein JTZ10_21555 [Gordonia rubripertincta]|uniref:Uncharacterized protein n=1 Tax=Gordonia rubripertincta TaxID=36822 RepID=A0AAW4GBC5_GORRU|nr:hypothetical protein [Gordonia rubripertincta]MBM7280334.1 hypothetical protein [Gordonia rubripertincta]